MKRFILYNTLFIFVVLFGLNAHAGIKLNHGDNVFSSTLAIGKTTAADSKAAFEVVSTTKGAISCPKMTTTQRDNISSPATGSCVYNTSTNAFNLYTGSSWTAYLSDPTITTGDILYRSSSGSLDRLHPGTSPKVLQTNGTTAGPTWSSLSITNMSTGIVRATGTPTGTLNTSQNIVIFGTETHDEDSAYNNTTGIWTAPRTGYVRVTGRFGVIGTYGGGAYTIAMIYKNGAQYSYCDMRPDNSSGFTTAQCDDIVKVNQSDTLAIYSQTGASAPSFSSATGGSIFAINYIGN